MGDDDPDGRRPADDALRESLLAKRGAGLQPDAPTIQRGLAGFTRGSATCVQAWRQAPSPFWTGTSRAGWRADLSQSIPLGRAVLELGRALFEGDWDDDDLASPLLSNLEIAAGHGPEASRQAWLRIHAVFDKLARAGQSGTMEWRIQVSFRSPLRAVMVATADDLLRIPPKWLSQPTLDHVFHDCRIDALDPTNAHVRLAGIGSDVFVDRAGLLALMENPHWTDGARASWPEGNAGMVYFGQAVLDVGRAMFKDRWRPDGMAQPLPSRPPEFPGSELDPGDRALALLRFTREMGAVNARRAGSALIDAARDGIITIYMSEYQRRAYEEIPATWWVADRWDHIFRNCSINRNKPQSSDRPKGLSRQLFVPRTDVEALVRSILGEAAPAPPPSSDTAVRDQPRRTRGRRPKWDWDGLMGELLRIADEDGLDRFDDQAAVEKWAADWFLARTGNHPSESGIRAKVAPVFQARDDNNAAKKAERDRGQ